MEWEQLLIQVVYLLIATFIPVVGLALRKRIATYNKLDEMLLKEEWAEAAVKFAEQTYGALDGPQQLEIALDWASARMKEHGLKVKTDELRGLIEQAVYELKEGWYSYEEYEDDIL